ncbi:MAG TPA: VCBS repeat-containing protein [Gemmatimonadaceae bacterium]|nr:VCBS repeat-containing protein [Gemmatimonadaceae bacterium]
MPFRTRLFPSCALTLLLTFAAACGKRDRVFELLASKRTGITFANTITPNDSLNEISDAYIYNGAGVAVGDVDNDGLPDVFFAGNMVSSRLYRNRGGMRFEDVTAKARVATKSWATGVAMADVNDDGWLDIYVGVSGQEQSRPESRANLLFINNRDGTFTESAAAYGVADTGFTTHAAFLDYDGDGCIDLFVLENSPQDFGRSRVGGHPGAATGTVLGSYNQLYRNDCHGHFSNVSEQAGILRDAGYGLGVVVADLNRDGRPDIYVSNDGEPNDVVYVNNGDGTFTNRAGASLKHSSIAGMGVDAADFNNDGWPDIAQVDMLPRELDRQKRTTGYLTYNDLARNRNLGRRTDYSANSLQLSNGVTPAGDVVFSEVGRMAGISATDWSWSPLFADFDNDGRKDIFIGNGYPKAVNDLDYVNRIYAMLGRRSTGKPTRAELDLLARLPAYAETSYVFRNAGGLSFVDESKAWGLDRAAFSYGAAYADLDNDGKLDLVVNNIDGPAFVYRNVRRDDATHHWLAVRLQGDSPNRRGLGAVLVLTTGNEKQYLYQSPYRGFMSTVDDRPHFGLGAATRADTLEITWPDGRVQRLTDVAADQLIVVKQSDARARGGPLDVPRPQPAFVPLEPRGALAWRQQAPTFVDYSVQSLLPYMISRHGPALAVADVDGDGLDDVYIGGGDGTPGKLLLQRSDGSFADTAKEPWSNRIGFDDWGALFFDANGDGRPDLYVTSGGYQLGPGDPRLQDRLYINRGGGVFVRDEDALPEMLTSTASVRAADFDGDGTLDLFVGGRLTPLQYPAPTRSYILRNDGTRDGRLHFTDVTEQVAPELVQPGGMITDALWVDFDGDGKPDLVVAGEWMPIRFFHNEGTRLREVTEEMHLPPTRGWWFSLAAGDFDHDGRPDIVAGNLGLNYSYTTSPDSPFGVRAGDFTGNGATDIVLTKTIGGKEFPVSGLATLGRYVYTFGVQFPTSGSFAAASIDKLLTPAQLQRSLHYQTDTFASVVLHNDGGKGFSMTALPDLAQISPIRGIVVRDVNGDGAADLIVAGNLYDAEPNVPRADAGNGLWLRGDGKGRFAAVPSSRSGFLAPLNATSLALLKTITGVGLLVANAGDSLQAYRIVKP